MRLAIATQRELPSWEVDDRALFAAIARHGVPFEQPVWDDPEVDWGAFDGVLIRTTWDYYANLRAYLTWADDVESRTRLFNPAAVVRWNTHKSYLHDLQRRGAPIVPTAWLCRGGRVDVAALCEERGFERAFLKPMVGSTARETLRFATDADGLRTAQAHVDRLLPHEDLMLQPYLESVEVDGELSLIVVDGVATHGVRKIPVRGDYRVQDDFGARDERHEFPPDERELAQQIVALAERHLELAAGTLLYARVDFLRNGEGELNLVELELVEPSLFFRHEPLAADRLADALIERVQSVSGTS